MKKLAIIVVAMFVAAMFTAPAFAEDRLSLSGGYFVRGWNVDSGDGIDDQSWFHQRMRVQAKIAVADDVTATIRADIAEAVWGADFGTSIGGNASVARPSETTEIQFDRTYVTIDKEMWSLQAGQQFLALGIAEVMDSQITGLNAGLKFAPVKVNLIYAKIDENDAKTDESDIDTDDADLYAVNVGLAAGGFNTNFFGVMVTDDGATDIEPWAVGINTSGTVADMVNLVAELDFLGGDAGAVDFTGLNFYLKGDVAVNDMITVGAEFLYGDGDDTDTQITGITNWDTFTPFSMGTPMDGWITAFDGTPFDMAGNGTGTIGATLFASAAPMEKLSLGGKLGYFVNEEDSIVDVDMFAMNAWVAYEIASNTKVSLTYLYSDYDYSVVDPDAVNTLALELAVSF